MPAAQAQKRIQENPFHAGELEPHDHTRKESLSSLCWAFWANH